MPGLGKGVQRGKGLALVALVGLLDALGVGAHVGAGQALGDVGLQRIAQVGHGLAQVLALAGGQAQRARALGGLEVVQVAQVRRHGALGGGGLHGLAQERAAPAAHLAQHEQVVVRLLHGQAKPRSRFGALLANPGQVQVLQFAGVSKAQALGRNAQPQLLGGEGGGRHGDSLFMYQKRR